MIYQKAKELGLKIHPAGNVHDHVHIVISIHPKISVADCVRHLKGAGAYAINHMDGSDGKFKWQAGYGAISVGEGTLPTVVAYANRQKEHCKDRRIVNIFERIDDD